MLEILLEMVGLVRIGRPELFSARAVQIADGQDAVFVRPDGRSDHPAVGFDQNRMTLADLEPVGDSEAYFPAVLLLLVGEIGFELCNLIASDEIREEVHAPAFRNRREDLHFDRAECVPGLADVVNRILVARQVYADGGERNAR